MLPYNDDADCCQNNVPGPRVCSIKQHNLLYFRCHLSVPCVFTTHITIIMSDALCHIMSAEEHTQSRKVKPNPPFGRNVLPTLYSHEYDTHSVCVFTYNIASLRHDIKNGYENMLHIQIRVARRTPPLCARVCVYMFISRTHSNRVKGHHFANIHTHRAPPPPPRHRRRPQNSLHGIALARRRTTHVAKIASPASRSRGKDDRYARYITQD